MANKPESDRKTPVLNEQMETEKLQDIIERYRQYLMNIDTKTTPSDAFDLTLVYPETNKKQVLTEQVDSLKKCLDSFRPFNPAQLENLEEAFDIEYTYESNRIEGNSLTLQETALVVSKDVTISGKPLKDHLEAVNHSQALDYVKELAQNKIELNEYELKSIHHLILSGIDRKNSGVYRNVPVSISGSIHKPPQPYLVPKQMEDYFRFYEENKNTLHPVLLAADMHEKLVTIHPFIDGNGRTSRLLMNLILLQNGYSIVNISGEPKNRKTYYEALENTRNENGIEGFHTFILQREKESLIKYLDMVAVPNEDNQDKGEYFYREIAPFV